MAELKFDEAEVNTNLAKEYLKNNKVFKSKGFNDSKESAKNDYNNTIQFSEYKRTSGSVILCNDINDVHGKLYNLAKKIEENVDLFCQLELLIRKIPLEDTKNIDLKLIIQNLIFYSSPRRFQVARTTAREIAVTGDSPLLALGCVAQVLIARMPRIVIECTEETAPVCSLFTDLCHGVGLKEKVLLAILPRIPEEKMFKRTVDFRLRTGFVDGGVGIVSGKGDVDSAVDTFLNSSCRYPWRVNKILVQECALERFKRALAWKSERRAPAASWRWTDEVCGPEPGREVSLEAYRTVRELLALLGALRPLAASLWSSDVAESLEIAHGLSATVVWINDFADFRGPPSVSQAFYSVVDSYFSTQLMEYMPEFDAVTKLRESWLRFGLDERKDVVRNALSEIDYKEANKIIEAIKTITLEMDSFVYVTENMVSTGLELLPETMLQSSNGDNSLDLSIISYIIRGGAVLLHVPERVLTLKASSDFYAFYENLRILGAPVLFTKESYKIAREIAVTGDSPLLALGCVAQVLIARMPRIVIECTEETAPVCSLFTDLCHGVGLKEKVLLAILPRIPEEKMFKRTVDFRLRTGFVDGGVGIVSGKGDVDSAVDTFLNSSCRYPWRVNKILVQECALERFKRALAWKSERRAPAASWRWTDEVCGPEPGREVSLEAYRTVRELLALLGALRPLAASLWSSDVAESLEIAHGLSATVVWINDFADFRGPPPVAQAFYSVVDSYFSTQLMEYMPEFDAVTKLRESWLRFGLDERKDVVRNALSEIDYKEANKIIEAIKTITLEMDSFVYVTENMVSTGLELLPETMLQSSNGDNSLDLSIISYIIRGGAVLLHVPERVLTLKASSDFYAFYENLRILGAPVLFTKESYKIGTIPILINPIYRYKVIWTSYGTIFAN